MRIETVPCLSDNLSYLVVDEATRTCVAIDTGEAKPFLDTMRAQSLRLVAILATHHHYDHIGALSQFPEVPVWSSKRDFDRVPGAGKSHDRHAFSDGTRLSWSDLARDPALANVSIRLSTLSIPGHTEGQTALIFDDPSASDTNSPSEPTLHVFVGDTLFALGCGRCLEGTSEELFASLQKLKALPATSRVYFGHEYTEKNALFWLSHASRDPELIDSKKITALLATHSKTPLPKPAPTLAEAVNSNPFLQIKNASEFKRWRELRNVF